MCGLHAKHFKAVLSCSLRGRQVGRVGRDRTARAVRGPAGQPSAAGDCGAGLRARKAAFSWLGGVNYGYSGRPQVQLVRVTVSLRVKYLAHMVTYSRARQQVSPALPGCQAAKSPRSLI